MYCDILHVLMGEGSPTYTPLQLGSTYSVESIECIYQSVHNKVNWSHVLLVENIVKKTHTYTVACHSTSKSTLCS